MAQRLGPAVAYDEFRRHALAAFSVGTKLRQERAGQGLTIEDVAARTKIQPRFLEAIEKDDFASLPGLFFTRNFVRQYALTLNLDPAPLLADLPKIDESSIPLPDANGRPHAQRFRNVREQPSAAARLAWLLFVGGVGFAAYVHFTKPSQRDAGVPDRRNTTQTENHASRSVEPIGSADVGSPSADDARKTIPAPATVTEPAPAEQATGAVRVTLTASETSWVQISADGKNVFTGTLQPNETKDISAAESVKLLAGNAGGLTISLNGKTLDAIGPAGQVRTVILKAGGPEFPSRDPQPAPDPI